MNEEGTCCPSGPKGEEGQHGNRFYAGIGSRKTPKDIQVLMKRLAIKLANDGWILRSGGADGADAVFEDSCIEAAGEHEIFLPWSAFNERLRVEEGKWKDGYYCLDPKGDEWAFQKAQQLGAEGPGHWENGSEWVKRLWARNMMQILGQDGTQPSSFIVCWTHQKDWGGTGWALRAALKLGMPIRNLNSEKICESVEKYLNST